MNKMMQQKQQAIAQQLMKQKMLQNQNAGIAQAPAVMGGAPTVAPTVAPVPTSPYKEYPY